MQEQTSRKKKRQHLRQQLRSSMSSDLDYIDAYFNEFTKKDPKKDFVEKVCELAKSQNFNEIDKLIEAGNSIDTQYTQHSSAYCAVYLLAREGEIEAVNALVAKYGADRNEAVEGYFHGLPEQAGFVKKVALIYISNTEDTELCELMAKHIASLKLGIKTEELLAGATLLKSLYKQYCADKRKYASLESELIYQLAKAKDKENLQKVLALGLDLEPIKPQKFHDWLLVMAHDLGVVQLAVWTPILVSLVVDGDQEAVDFLLSFNQIKNRETVGLELFLGAALKGNQIEVENYIIQAQNYPILRDHDRRSLLKLIISCFAYGGHLEIARKYVNDLLEEVKEANAGENRAAALSSEIIENENYADDLSPELIEEIDGGIKLDDIAQYYMNIILLSLAVGGNVTQVNQLLSEGIPQGYVAFAFMFCPQVRKPDTLLELLSLVNDDELRESIARQAIDFYLPHLQADAKALVKTASKLHFLRNNHQLTFDQAMGYLTPGACGWFLLGDHLTSDYSPKIITQGIEDNSQPELPKLPKELYLKITSFFTCLPEQDNFKIALAFREKVLKEVRSDIGSKITDSNLSKQDGAEKEPVKEQQAEKNSENGMNFKF
jgi:hypothetical protein